MSLNNYLVLTEHGLSAVAIQPWPQISVRYFIPIYDERVDTLIHTEDGATSALPLTAAITSADTQSDIYGERIYNLPSTSGVYELTNDYVATSASGSYSTGTTVFNTVQTKTISKNLFNGNALSNFFSGSDEPTYNIGDNSLSYDNPVSDVIGVPWSFDTSNISRDKLFSTVSFFPNQTPVDESTDVVNGTFQFELRNDVGSYRFNKVAMFIQPMNADGTVNTSYEPILFGQVIFNKSQIVEVGGTGSQTFEVAVQLAFTIKNGNVIVTNNDYWTMLPTSASTRNQNGLFFPGDVALGTSAVPNSWQPHAKLQLTDDTGSPQIRLANTDALSGFDVTFVDSPTSAMVSHVIPQYSNGIGYTWGLSAFAVGAPVMGAKTAAFALGDYAAATYMGSFALGTHCSALAPNAFSIGLYNNITWKGLPSDTSFAIGQYNSVSADTHGTTIALGQYNYLHGGYAVGRLNFTSGGYDNFAIGAGNYAGGFLSYPYISYAFTLGTNSSALNNNSYAFGTNNYTSAPFSYAAGHSNYIDGPGLYNYVFGYNNRSSNNGNTNIAMFGTNNIANFSTSLAIGHNNTASIATAVAIGVGNTTHAVAVGISNAGSGYTFGKNCDAYLYSVALGLSAKSFSYESTSIGIDVAGVDIVYGAGSSTNPKYSDSITSAYGHNTMIGTNLWMTDKNYDSVLIGSDSFNHTTYGESINIGKSTTTTKQSISIGSWSRAYGTASLALGTSARCMANSSGAADYDNTTYGRQIAIGYDALSYGQGENMAIGSSTTAQTSGSGAALAFGPRTYTKNINVIAGARMNMTTIGYSLTNEYASFMAGLLPATLSKMETVLSASCADWTFLPTSVFGNGSGVGRNGLMVGNVNRLTDNVSVVVLDYDSMPTIGGDGIPSGLPSYYQDCPPGTIFRFAAAPGATTYGFTPLYIWNGTGASD